jgi:alpha-ketoglutarate-dependent taurine dioxygenase
MKTAKDNIAGAANLIETKRIQGAFGVEVLNVDVTSPEMDASMDAIRQAFLDNYLMVFPGQDLTNDDMLAFSQRFGEVADQIFRTADGQKLSPVHSISNFDADGKPSKNPYLVANYSWHTDHAFRVRPSSITMLYGVEIPPIGGDTEFADMTKAYETLPDATKTRIDGMLAEHSFEYMRRTVTDRPASESEIRDAPPSIHPLVRTHAETGRKSLYLGMCCSHITGLPREEGRKLLDELTEHATQPQFVVRHRWRLGDLVMWDNRCLLHRAIPNYDIAHSRRLLTRLNLRDGVPA